MDIKIIPAGTTESARPLSFSAAPKFKLSVTRDGDLTTCSGVEALAQRVLRNLFTKRGSVPGRPREGSILSIVPGTMLSDVAEASSLVEDAISSVSDEMKRQQSGVSRYKSSERLGEIRVVSVYISTDMHLQVSLQVSNILGEKALFYVGGGSDA
jgi:hypothetical protein